MEFDLHSIGKEEALALPLDGHDLLH
jgi:hypothetical protein